MKPFDLRQWIAGSKIDGSKCCLQNDPFIIDQVTVDSRRIATKNALFVALPGANCDGTSFLKEAYKRGAKA
ncbi:MAG TPA: Mur ligase domain-containing protein, partial [Chlamydiales bacterium]|nr:Mur ligase domain-containing protein [Chlamydiales bacterium]